MRCGLGASAKEFLEQGRPVISVDTKKKKLVGSFKNAGKEWHRKGDPVQVTMRDFSDQELGKAILYGVHDIGRNEGWVAIGTSHDTAEFAVGSIRRWWTQMGQPTYPRATDISITAGGGRSNGTRFRFLRLELQRLADVFGLVFHVRHFPPGTSKGNKIEHRMFCHITDNWRGQPLLCRVAVVEPIGATNTVQGLTIRTESDEGDYETGKKVKDKEMKSPAIEHSDFHGESNYRISPHPLDERTQMFSLFCIDSEALNLAAPVVQSFKLIEGKPERDQTPNFEAPRAIHLPLRSKRP